MLGLVALGRLVGNQELFPLLIEPTEGDDPLLVDLAGNVPNDAPFLRLLGLHGIGGVPGGGIVTGEITTSICDRRQFLFGGRLLAFGGIEEGDHGEGGQDRQHWRPPNQESNRCLQSQRNRVNVPMPLEKGVEDRGSHGCHR